MNVVPSFIFSCLVYWIAGLNNDGARFLFFFLIVSLIGVAAQTLGMAISAFMPSVEAAQAGGPVFLILGIVFGGFYM